MANWTDLYRRRGHHIAIVVFNKDGKHRLVRGSEPLPTKPTWDRHGPFIPGHIYAVLQEFVDYQDAKNNYTVFSVSDLTERGITTEEACDLTTLIFNEAKTSRSLALDDKWFLAKAHALGLLTNEQYEGLLRPRPVPTTTPTRPTTLVF